MTALTVEQVIERVIANYQEHYDFPPQGESHMRDCLADALAAPSEFGTWPTEEMLKAFWIATGADPEKMEEKVPLDGTGQGCVEMVSAWVNASIHFGLAKGFLAMLAAAPPCRVAVLARPTEREEGFREGAEALLREAREILRHSRNHTINVGDCDTCLLIDRIDAHLSGKDRT